MLRIDTIAKLEDFFHQKKMITLDAIGREPSEATIDIYIRGFLRQIMERVQDMAPELRTSGYGHAPPRYDYNREASYTGQPSY